MWGCRGTACVHCLVACMQTGMRLALAAGMLLLSPRMILVGQARGEKWQSQLLCKWGWIASSLLSLPLSSRSGASNFTYGNCDLAGADNAALAACGVNPNSDNMLYW